MITSQTIEANGLSFHCLTAGDPSRPLLLMLHGFPEYSGGWEEMLERLSDDYFCVAPDQRGYNTTSKPEAVAEYTGGKLARDAAAILTHFAPRARAVIGHDWGASVAYALSFARPDLMDRLIILNGAHPIPFQRALATGGAQAEASQYIDYLRSPKAEARLSADNFAKLAALFADGMDMSWLSGKRLEQYRAAWGQPGALLYTQNGLYVADSWQGGLWLIKPAQAATLPAVRPVEKPDLPDRTAAKKEDEAASTERPQDPSSKFQSRISASQITGSQIPHGSTLKDSSPSLVKELQDKTQNPDSNDTQN